MFIMGGWTVAPDSQITGRVPGVWSPGRILLHVDPAQEGEGRISGDELRKKLDGKPVLSAAALDHFLANPKLIPESWKRDGAGNLRGIFFWGTIYRDESDRRWIRCLYWNQIRWESSGSSIHNAWLSHMPAAILAG